MDEKIAAAIMVVEPLKAISGVNRAELKFPSASGHCEEELLKLAKAAGDTTMVYDQFTSYQQEWQVIFRFSWQIETFTNYALYIRQQCLQRTSAPSLGQLSPPLVLNQIQKDLAKGELDKVELIVELLQRESSTRVTFPGVNMMSSVFQGIGRALHIARVAYEQGRIDDIKGVQEAIHSRWTRWQLNQRAYSNGVAAKMSDLFKATETAKTFAEVLTGQRHGLSGQAELHFDHMWPDIKGIPNLTLKSWKGAIVCEDSARQIWTNQDRVRVFLKTPALVSDTTHNLHAAHSI